MILPITLPFNRPGLPGGGVPAFSIDPETGEVVGDVGHLIDWEDPTAADPFAGDAGDLDAAGGGAVPVLVDSDGLIVAAPLNNSLLTTHGAPVWDSRGSYRNESAFDLWRRAGKPVPCGMGDAQEVLNAIAVGTSAAAGYQYGGPGYVGYRPAPQVAVAGSASTGAWILGAIGLGVVIFGISRR
jgi:hypothetical protein